MDNTERERLEKLLGMLGSSFDGERANAARMISAMAEQRKLTIVELVYGKSQQQYKGYQQTNRQNEKKRFHEATIIEELRAIGDSEDELEFVITSWEQQFCSDVSSKHEFDYELSEKQLSVAQRIIDKVKRHSQRQGAP